MVDESCRLMDLVALISLMKLIRIGYSEKETIKLTNGNYSFKGKEHVNKLM